jgi:ABC-type Mn2+/Zn2+ transport system permease subunit
LLILLGMAVVVSAQGVGTLLAPAVLIGPAATARLLTRRMAPMMGAAIAFGIGAGAAGLYLSFYAGSAAGASIAGTIVAAYVVVALITRGSRSRP